MLPMIEHHIQLDILKRLARNDTLRFSELKPDGMENNAFMYHLTQMQKMKYVEKTEAGYQLTTSGKTYSTTLSRLTGRPRQQPRAMCLIALFNAKGNVLLAKRKEQPMIGAWTLLTGKQHFGELTETHVAREVLEQIGAVLEVERRGFVDIMMRHTGQVVTHDTGHVYSGHYQGEAPLESTKYEYAWHDRSNLPSLMPGISDALDALDEQSGDIYLSLDVQDK